MMKMLAYLRHQRRIQRNASLQSYEVQQERLASTQAQPIEAQTIAPTIFSEEQVSPSELVMPGLAMPGSAMPGVFRHVAWLSTSIALSGIASMAAAEVSIAQVRSPAPQDEYGVSGEGRGESIAALQRQLSTLGYYNGEISGYYGPQTQEAVVRFQRDMGLAPDGIVGPATSQALYQYGSPAGSASQSQTPNAALPTIQLNDGGEQVAELQRRLADLGYNPGGSGTFDYPTEAAVMQFQRDNGLTPDGVVGPSTEAALRRPSSELARPGSLSGDAAPGNAAPGNAAPAEANQSNGVLRLGDNGQPVSNLQLRLKELGFYQGEVSGVYGPETEAAVLAFQQSQGLIVDGIAGAQVNSSLFSFNQSPAGSTSTSVGGTSSTVPPAQPEPMALDNANGTPTAESPNPAGNAPAATPQGNNPQTSVPQTNAPQTGVPQTGVPQTGTPQTGTPQVINPQEGSPEALPQLEQVQAEAEQARLEAEQARLEAEQAQMVLFQNMDEGRYSVASLQRQLRNQGYYLGDVTGVFSSDTQSAIVEAQRNYGLTETDLFDDGGVTYQFPY
jgi:peptidoglycan hydrolase-like protein with peptidoglycan-binding domain